MGIKQDVETSLKAYSLTKIDGQPRDDDLNQLERELSEIAASIPTTNGGGMHGHIGLILDNTEYITFSHGNAPFIRPTHPGAYPITVDNDKIIRERQIAEHKATLAEFETFLGVETALRKMIAEAVNTEWLEALKDERLGFLNITPLQMLTHLRTAGGTLDYMDESQLFAELMKPWDVTENPATKFARDDKLEKQLVKIGYADQQKPRLAFALSAIKATGDYDPLIREWDAKTATDRTFANFRPFFINEYSQHSRHHLSTATSVGRGLANAATEAPADDSHDDAAWALAEVATAMQAAQDKQTDKMMQMFQTFMQSMGKTPSPTALPSALRTNTNRRNVCPHCKLRHRDPSGCWELETNREKRPSNWKPAAQRASERSQRQVSFST